MENIAGVKKKRKRKESRYGKLLYRKKPVYSTHSGSELPSSDIAVRHAHCSVPHRSWRTAKIARGG
ncbi:MAG: hypothetical protein ABSB22_25755 [Thermodesulfobacteriota bacterium]